MSWQSNRKRVLAIDASPEVIKILLQSLSEAEAELVAAKKAMEAAERKVKFHTERHRLLQAVAELQQVYEDVEKAEQSADDACPEAVGP